MSPTFAAATATPSYARTALSVAIVALLYLWVFPYHAQVNNPNENVRVYMTVAIVDDHTFAINRIERDWGYTNDKSTRLGKLYSSKAPGTSYLGVPAYWLLTKITHRDSHPLTPAQIRVHHKPPLDRDLIIYVLRLWSNVLPALIFAWFWHRFLGRRTRVAALREAVFFSTMAGSLLFAYSEMFASHADNALCAMAGIMALSTVRERDRNAVRTRATVRWNLGLMFVAGLFGAAATMFEYPAALATGVVAMLVLATAAERHGEIALFSIPLALAGARLATTGHKSLGLALGLLAVVNYALTLTPRSLVRLVFAGLGAALPTFLTLFYHKRCFGDPFKPGYSFLENPTFHAETSQGFFGATAFSWEAGIRLWLDPAFGLVPMTAIFLAAILGFGAYLAWRPPRIAVWPIRIGLLLVVALCAYKSVDALLAAKNANWSVVSATQCHWVAYLVVACVVLASVCLRRPSFADPAVGASMLLACFLLTRLIGAMNNWRGGWEVGPRYLATLAPMLGLAALVGLDSFASRSTAHRRAATLFAAASTVLAVLMSGLPSAFFPHIPTEFVSPFFELIVPVVRDGFVPHNAGQYLFHWAGLTSMVPFAIGVALLVALVVRGEEKRAVAILAHSLAALAIVFVMLAPFAAIAKPENLGVTRFVKTVWEPRPAGEGSTGAGAARSPDALRAQGRQMAETGDFSAAFDAFKRAAAQTR